MTDEVVIDNNEIESPISYKILIPGSVDVLQGKIYLLMIFHFQSHFMFATKNLYALSSLEATKRQKRNDNNIIDETIEDEEFGEDNMELGFFSEMTRNGSAYNRTIKRVGGDWVCS